LGVAWGLAAALLWGLADFTAAVASRQTGAFRVAVTFHVLATTGLAIVCAATGAIDDVAPGDVWKFVWVGALGALSYATFYKSLEIGPISIASPIISAYAAVTVVLAVLVIGETLSAGQTAAIVVVMVGVLLASADLAQLHRVERRQALGLVLALVTAVAIGVFVFGNAYYTAEYGWLLPIFLSRGLATVFLLGAAAGAGTWRPEAYTHTWLGLVLLLAVLDTGGFVAFTLGAERAETSVVGAASAPYAVIPIVAGVLLFRERPAVVQWGGVVAVIGGVILLGLTS
jgi:drug/metabolite transporter (DMT)-like permease